MDTFANALRQARRDNGHTQRDLAEHCSVSPSMVARWELSDRSPGEPHFNTLADYMGISYSDVWSLVRDESDIEPGRFKQLESRVTEIEKHLGLGSTS